MPRVTQYIRDEDKPIWDKISNKSEWIHLHLHHESEMKVVETAIEETNETLSSDEPTIVSDEYDQTADLSDKCPAGHPITPGSQHCLLKSCKYYKKEIR